jgi:hypothetical protein
MVAALAAAVVRAVAPESLATVAPVVEAVAGAHFLPLQAMEVEGLFNRELRFQIREEHREPECPATSPKVRRERGPEMQLAWE